MHLREGWTGQVWIQLSGAFRASSPSASSRPANADCLSVCRRMNRAQLGLPPTFNPHQQQPQPAQQSLSSLIFFIILLTLLNSGPNATNDQQGGGLEAYVPTSEYTESGS